MPDSVIMVDRMLVKGIADMLKTLDINGGFAEWKKYIGCIELLDQIANSPKPEEKTEEVKDG